MRKWISVILHTILISVITIILLAGCRQVHPEDSIDEGNSNSEITLPNDQVVAVGGSIYLTLNDIEGIDYDKNAIVSWKSYDPSKATVNSRGKIDGISTGTAVIEASYEDGTKISTTITVYNLVCNIQNPLMLEEGQSIIVTPIITPQGAISLSDISVTTFSEGDGEVSIEQVSGGSMRVKGETIGDTGIELSGPGEGLWSYPIRVVPNIILGAHNVDVGDILPLYMGDIDGCDMSQVEWFVDSEHASLSSTTGASTQLTGVKSGTIEVTATLGEYKWCHEVIVYNAFETVWDIPADNSSLILPLDGVYHVIVDWGDGSDHETFLGTEYTPFGSDYPSHQYATAGQYVVELYTLDGFPLDLGAWGFDGDRSESLDVAPWLIDVTKWGDAKIGYSEAYWSYTSGRGFFRGCKNLTQFSALDTPYLEGSLAKMFSGAEVFNGDISGWNTSQVTSFSELFYRAELFNQPIGDWSTHNVTNMNRTFYYAKSFNQEIDNWNVDSVTDMQSMFQGAASYNKSLNSWNTGNVENMANMFNGATTFNGAIGQWNTSQVTTMGSMFKGAELFNQSIGDWDTYKVTATGSMFAGASNFNQDISKWRMDNNTQMTNMFRDAVKFNSPINTNKVEGYWNVGNVRDMAGMFYNAQSFNQPLNNWNTSSVESMFVMFREARRFNQDLNSWVTANVIRMDGMFEQAINFNGNISGWNTSRVELFNNMFRDASRFNGNLRYWNVRNTVISEGFDWGATAWVDSNKPNFPR